VIGIPFRILSRIGVAGAALAAALHASLTPPGKSPGGFRVASLVAPAAPAAAESTLPALSRPAKPAPDGPLSPAGPAASPDLGAIVKLAREGQLDTARALALKALAASPDAPALLLLLGKLAPSGKEAADYFKRAIQAAPASATAEEAYFRLGLYTYATGKYYLAIPNFRDYLTRFPQGEWRDPALYWMGNACLALARSRNDKAAYLDSGEAWFGKLLEATKPGDYYRPLALEGLAKAKAGKGDREGAWQQVQAALEKAPEEEKPPLLLLAAQTRQGTDRAGEKSLLAQLVARYPQSPEARYLRKLNAGADTSRWKSGSGFPRAPSPSPAPDSAAVASQGNVKATEALALPSPGDAGGKPFTLQCGAFTQAANAEAMMKALGKLGLSPETVERDHGSGSQPDTAVPFRGGKRIYLVRVGRFATIEEAEAFARDRLKPQRVISQPVPVAP
jgi:TolA-binding protein